MSLPLVPFQVTIPGEFFGTITAPVGLRRAVSLDMFPHVPLPSHRFRTVRTKDWFHMDPEMLSEHCQKCVALGILMPEGWFNYLLFDGVAKLLLQFSQLQ